MSEKDSYHSMRLIVIVFLWLFAFYVALNAMRDSETPVESSRPPVPSVRNRGVCRSPACITLAHQLHNFRDVSMDPCQDFYKAVCGKYNEHTTFEFPRVFKKSSILVQLVAEFLRQKPSSTSKPEKSMKLVYDKCEEAHKMNQTVLDSDEDREMLQIMKQLGSWPMVTKNWDESEFELNDALTNMAKLGILDFGFFKRNLQTVISWQMDNMTATNMEKFLADFLEMNDIQFDNSSFKADVEELGKFTNELASLTSIPSNVSILGIDDLREKLPMVDFERIIKSLMNEKRKEIIWEKVKPKIWLPSTHPYISSETGGLGFLLKTTNKRTLANFLFYRILLGRKDIKLETMGTTSDHCAKLAVGLFPVAALRIYTHNHYDKEDLDEAASLVDDVQDSFIQTFKDSTWLHETTKTRAIRKVELMKKVVGYPKEMEVPGALDSLYESLDLITTDSYLTTIFKISKFRIEQRLDLAADLNPFTMGMTLEYAAAGAFYLPMKNELIVTIPLIDDPVFDSTFPKYVKVASIGAVIGHEMGHGFDVQGKNYDEKGEKNNWWTPEDSAEYDGRTQCLIDNFHSYDDPDFGRKLNGSTTVGEHAADVIGVQLSLKSYKKVDFASEPSIFGFEDERPDKLFFHLTALNWCRSRERTPLDLQLTRVHPTSSFRVNGIFSNMKEFAEAFSCPVGSPMNPEKKCELF